MPLDYDLSLYSLGFVVLSLSRVGFGVPKLISMVYKDYVEIKVLLTKSNFRT